MKRTTHTKQRGFTIIETFIASVLLTLTVAGTMALTARTISFYNNSEDRLTATYLANEALEYVKSARQDNILTNAPWLAVLSAACQGPDGCYIDTHIKGSMTLAQSVHDCNGSCPPIKYRSDTKMYLHTNSSGNPWDNSRVFQRRVVITNTTADEVVVAVTVGWTVRKINYSLTVSDTLFNWQ
jgi:type II secretory pathway pseudopilin PulG